MNLFEMLLGLGRGHFGYVVFGVISGLRKDMGLLREPYSPKVFCHQMIPECDIKRSDIKRV